MRHMHWRAVCGRQGVAGGVVGGRGSYVVDPNRSNDQPFKLKSEGRDGFDLSISRPVFSNIHVDRFQKLLAEIPNDLDPSVYLSCRPNIGHEAHRVTGVKWLAACGIEATPEQIIMTNGVTTRHVKFIIIDN